MLTNSIDDDAAWAGKKESSVWVKHYNAAQHRALLVKILLAFLVMGSEHAFWLVLHHFPWEVVDTVLEGQGSWSYMAAQHCSRQLKQASQFIGNPCLRTCRAKATRISTTTLPNACTFPVSTLLCSKRNAMETLEYWALFLDGCPSAVRPVR